VTSEQDAHAKAEQDATDERLDRPFCLTCPDCGGGLRRSDVGPVIKYDCHIGHSYTAEAMAAAQFEDMERLMRAAERVLNERSEFCRQMAERDDQEAKETANAWRSASAQARERAYALRDFIEQDWISPGPNPE
jgi:two-component system chemotaxis response regulator CheB